MTQGTKTFTIGGRQHSVSVSRVTKGLSGVEPQPVARYFVTVNGNRYPLKQAFSKGTGLPPVAFNSQQAYRILTSIGLEVEDQGA